MIKQVYVMILIFSFFSSSAISNGVNFNDEIIYEFKSYPKKITFSSYSLKDFFTDNNVKYLKDIPFNKIFVPGTTLDTAEKHRRPYNGAAVFFKELPSKSTLRLLIFAYWDRDYQDSYLNLPTLELQVFDGNLKLTDKVIIVDGASAECSYLRRTKIFTDLSFQVIDTNSCWDMEKDMLVVNNERKFNYYITKDGKIKPKSER